MALLPFIKVEGLGNDFLVVDLRPGKPAHPLAELATRPETVRALCDRNFGVGGDGVLAILPGDAGDARMRVLNADGSEAEMCGNGIRCVAKVLHETDASLRRDVLRIDTGAGLLACKLEVRNQRVATVTVDMGAPQLVPRLVPVQSEAPRLVRAPLPAGARTFAFTAVSMGNPHAVIFVDEPGANLRELARGYGPGIERDPRFPRRTNVEFAAVRRGLEDGSGKSRGEPAGSAGRVPSREAERSEREAGGREGASGLETLPGFPMEIDLVVWERGCGITLACGTGACATTVAACLEGRAAADREIPVHLPGGTLFITVHSGAATADGPSYAGVDMRGPANIVFEAAIDPAAIHLPSGR
jgi:diaminopimelate epimerase